MYATRKYFATSKGFHNFNELVLVVSLKLKADLRKRFLTKLNTFFCY